MLAMLTSQAVSALAWYYGGLGLFLGVLSGFVFLGPLLALALYSVSEQLQRGREPSTVRAVRVAMQCLGNALVFTIALTIVFLVWARAASMVHVFFPADSGEGLDGLWLFLLVGSAVGAVFAAIVFTASAFSLPMMVDRRTDAITAIVTSVNAVLRNKPVAALWGALIVVVILVGVTTAYVGFVVLMPVLGYASWHAYGEAIDAEAWPPREPEIDVGSNTE